MLQYVSSALQYATSEHAHAAVSQLSRKEQILLVECLLYDVRFDWSNNEAVIARLTVAENICHELESDNELGDQFAILHEDISQLFAIPQQIDGRIFRQTFPDGYIDMDKLHNFKRPYDLSECSPAFVEIVDKCIVSKNWIFTEGKK